MVISYSVQPVVSSWPAYLLEAMPRAWCAVPDAIAETGARGGLQGTRQ